jgi:hypothetical protein
LDPDPHQSGLDPQHLKRVNVGIALDKEKIIFREEKKER